MKTATRNTILSSIATAFALTIVIWLTAGSLASRFDVVNEKYFSFYYPWQTRNPTTMAYITVWVGYALHNISAWAVIYMAKKEKPKYQTGFRWFNWAMLAVNGIFYILHWIQTQLWYDGLAIAVPEVTSQGSVVLMLVVILILETPRRGLALGKKVKFHKRFMQVVREYHGYLFSWAIIYTFWYHPMENTFGHLAGFFYIFLLLAQSVLLFNRAHLNKYWTFLLEAFVLIHGTLVAISQANGIWPMFAFGFGAMIVLTQMYGIGLNTWVRRALAVSFVIGVSLFYTLSGNLSGLNEVIRIPFIDYLLIGLLYLIFLGVNGVVSLFSNKSTQAS
ncbi:MAG: hypothetical protein HN390_16545 [Anaerolineae bacterium]|jgi:hypothetical protein|nr:hypothetical protein [Anaerolineae bacterium]MBT7191738.1 hypothetical protein [Anaerolineae bacterium]MBT7600584.1 hypothetical protein [Anaerolineae bacterium]MBT7989285.1 hypothetical protein [Anaerolineae bacterium]